MFRRVSKIATQHIRNANMMTNVAALQTRNATFRDTLTETDKWSKDKMKTPYEIAGKTPGVKVATDLFRHAYNLNQLGLFYQASNVMVDFLKHHKLPRKMYGDLAFYEKMHELGIPDEIAHELLPSMVGVGQTSEVPVVFKTYIGYYNAYLNFQPTGKLIHGAKKMNPKQNAYLNKNLISSVCLASGVTPQRVVFREELVAGLYGGYNIQVGNSVELHSRLSSLSKMKNHILRSDIEDII